MDLKVSFQTDLIDTISYLPIPHLSFVIKLLLPKRLVNNKTAYEYLNDVKDVIGDDSLLIKIRDTICGFIRNADTILVGSYAERYNIPYALDRNQFFKGKSLSDIDCLYVPLVLLEETLDLNKSASTSNEKTITIENVYPGYCRVQCKGTIDRLGSLKNFLVYNDELQTYYLDGKGIRNDTCIKMKCHAIHGPALSISLGGVDHSYLLDFVVAIKLQKWPVEARSFIERQQRTKWLTSEQITFIEQNGIHIVPVAHKLSPHPNIEWKYSFAETEVYIANNVITNQQRQCFVFLKLIYVQSLKQLELLSSYHLKTVFLFCCEHLHHNEWIDNIGSCLLYIIDTLIECVKKKFLPNFFIPENNLIDHLSDADFSLVLETLMSIRAFPLPPILEFTEVYSLDYCRISTSFRYIISPVLEDMVEFLFHRNISRTITHAFHVSIFKMVNALYLEGRLKDAISNVKDICQMMNKLSFGLTTNMREGIEQVFSDIHPYFLLLMGHIACISHLTAYDYPVHSEKRNLALTQAEALFNTVVDTDVSSPAVVDFSQLLIQQRRYDEAAEKLDSYIEAMMNKKQTIHCFYQKELTRLDNVIQKEVINNETIYVNSLSMGYYLIVKCIVKDDLASAESAVYQKILKYFTAHCDFIRESTSFSLLGYANMIVNNYLKAIESFEKALLTCNRNKKLIEDNKEFCKHRLSELKENEIYNNYLKAIESFDKPLVTCKRNTKLIKDNTEFYKHILSELKANESFCLLS